MIIVLDLNGVLFDVRRLESARVAGRPPDVVLPNRQKAYVRPGCFGFLKSLAGIPCTLVLFTSRLRKNAEPIEGFLGRSLTASIGLYGEDCDRTCEELRRPVKSARVVAGRLGRPLGAKENMVFVDDHPERIDVAMPNAGVAYTIGVSCYDAARDGEDAAAEGLRSALDRLKHLIQNNAWR
jgi:hypothetical protein